MKTPDANERKPEFIDAREWVRGVIGTHLRRWPRGTPPPPPLITREEGAQLIAIMEAVLLRTVTRAVETRLLNFPATPRRRRPARIDTAPRS